MIKITDVKVRLAPPKSKHLAVASITVNAEIIINDIKLYQSNNSFICVLPCNPRTAAHGKKNILIRNKSTYIAIKDRIVEQYLSILNQ